MAVVNVPCLIRNGILNCIHSQADIEVSINNHFEAYSALLIDDVCHGAD